MKKFLLIAALASVAAASQATVFSFTGGSLTLDSDGAPALQNYNVSGLDGAIVRVELLMNGVSHTFPDDIGAVLVNNVGNSAILFDGPGAGIAAVSLDWRFDDVDGVTTLPTTGALSSGTFLPGQNQYNDIFTNISGPFGTTMAGLNTGGNGTWTLHAEDFVFGDVGTINSTELRITTDAVPEPASMIALGAGLLALARRRRSK
ncbi:MAG TPA: PEP-CTERM sorting domain-containing protein [Fimbriimonadaceae bacterium]|nr:hypothetical protein [Armatimonadota bacterium]HRD31053.1 PEP-CTERM sorting domain-containing protein [Fimbriimonadaceae bacterium]HRE93443.1 PEP-CTERM sorting domain-containing protein [Fimbriimonadaceae bacterium]